MKKRVDRDEWWPVWGFDPTGEYEVEVNEAFIVRYVKALDEFNRVQDELRTMVERAAKPAPESAKQEER